MSNKKCLESLCQILATQDKTLESIHIHHEKQEPKNDKEGRGAPDFLIQRNGYYANVTLLNCKIAFSVVKGL